MSSTTFSSSSSIMYRLIFAWYEQISSTKINTSRQPWLIQSLDINNRQSMILTIPPSSISAPLIFPSGLSKWRNSIGECDGVYRATLFFIPQTPTNQWHGGHPFILLLTLQLVFISSLGLVDLCPSPYIRLRSTPLTKTNEYATPPFKAVHYTRRQARFIRRSRKYHRQRQQGMRSGHSVPSCLRSRTPTTCNTRITMATTTNASSANLLGCLDILFRSGVNSLPRRRYWSFTDSIAVKVPTWKDHFFTSYSLPILTTRFLTSTGRGLTVGRVKASSFPPLYRRRREWRCTSAKKPVAIVQGHGQLKVKQDLA